MHMAHRPIAFIDQCHFRSDWTIDRKYPQILSCARFAIQLGPTNHETSQERFATAAFRCDRRLSHARICRERCNLGSANCADNEQSGSVEKPCLAGSGGIDDACAAAQCSADAKFFRTQATGWQHLGLALILISAASTAVGTSATIANAKIWSTLGGTTGLGAATTAVNSDISGDQTGLSAVNSALAALTKLVTQSPAPAPLAIYQAAPLYAAQCDAAANTSSSSSPPKS